MAAKISGFEDGAGEALCDINVTPLVDVVLVLLIVFMITVPAIVGSAPVEVDLPGTSAIASAMEKAESLPLKVFVRQNADGQTQVYLGETSASLDGFPQFLKSLGTIDKDSTVHIAADQGLPYRDVIRVIDCLGAMGVHKLSLETKHVEAPSS